MGKFENSFSSRLSDFNYYRKTEGSEVSNQMIGSRFQMGTLDDVPDRSIATLLLDFSGSFEDSRSARQLISVNTDTPPLVSVGLAEEQLIQKGQITVQSSDGGVMTLVVKGSNEGLNPTQILVDWTSISADGITISDTGILLGSCNIENEWCRLASNETPLVRKDGNFSYTLP